MATTAMMLFPWVCVDCGDKAYDAEPIKHHALGGAAGILACELRGLSHESLACLAANLLHAHAVVRDILKGEGLVDRALEVASAAVSASGVEV